MGIQICYAPDSRAVTIAEHTVGLALPTASDGRLAGKTLENRFGLVGRQGPSGRRRHAYPGQPAPVDARIGADSGVESADLVYLLQHSDFISLHVPFSEGNRSDHRPRGAKLMKPGALLVNTGHTDLVDEKQLLAALDAGLLPAPPCHRYHRLLCTPPSTPALRNHEHVIISPTHFIDTQPSNA